MSIAGTLVRAGAAALGLALAACTVRAGPTPAYGSGYYASQPPSGIYGAPRGYYAGQTYYYTNDHWWYQSPRGGWTYLREEPAPLHRYRPGVAQPPPAYRPYGYGGGPRVPPPLPAPR
jgi:hypothetical protein